uniref:Protein kinase domain-containing protein n=1 Tax=Acrobeloides nanus TaxID=290746 RepID=A0A914DB92_9BILA
MAEVMNPCKTSRRHYSVVATALDENTNLDESLKHIMNIALLSCNKAQSTNKFVLVPTETYAEFICRDKDRLIGLSPNSILSLVGELKLNANWLSLYDHSTNSTCDPSMMVPEQEKFQFYHLPLNATTEDIESLIVCPTTPPSENFSSTTGLGDASKSTMISDFSTTSDISSTKNITNKSPDPSKEPTKSDNERTLSMKESVKRVIRYDNMKLSFYSPQGEEKYIDVAIKVADFGLCLCTADTPYVMKGGMMPLKWMAIEALRMLGFSEKTDVWSYGILLYEMFSIGQQPYACIEMSRGHKFTQQELLVFLQSGGRLEKPILCPENLYTLMESCWKEDPVERCSFKQIRESLLKMLEELDEIYGYVQIQEDENFRTEYVHIIK